MPINRGPSKVLSKLLPSTCHLAVSTLLTKHGPHTLDSRQVSVANEMCACEPTQPHTFSFARCCYISLEIHLCYLMNSSLPLSCICLSLCNRTSIFIIFKVLNLYSVLLGNFYHANAAFGNFFDYLRFHHCYF